MPNADRAETLAKARAARGSKDINPTDIIAALNVGESYAFSQILMLEELLNAGEEITTAMTNLRSKSSVYISRAKDPDGLDERSFSTRSGKYLSDDCKELVCVVTVKRDS